MTISVKEIPEKVSKKKKKKKTDSESSLETTSLIISVAQGKLKIKGGLDNGYWVRFNFHDAAFFCNTSA
jgi:hypothetical protein